MAKKKNDFDEEFWNSIMQSQNRPKRAWTRKDFQRIFTQIDPDKYTVDERMILIASAIFVQNGITPEVYKELFGVAECHPVVNLMPLNLLFAGLDSAGEKNSAEEDYDESEEHKEPRMGFNRGEGLVGFPLIGAENKSLILKIQLRGIKKPPLWREVRIPANFNFEQLHGVIQVLFGWEGGHLWNFAKEPYSRGYTIGMPVNGMDLDYSPTDDAYITPVTKVLKNKGDKIVYIYDFGDDWIHDISVREVLDEKTSFPVCLKWKGANPIEDIGGIWGLEEYRNMYNPDVKHTKAEIKEFIDNSWFESIDEFNALMLSREFDIEYVNDTLKSIKTGF